MGEQKNQDVGARSLDLIVQRQGAVVGSLDQGQRFQHGEQRCYKAKVGKDGQVERRARVRPELEVRPECQKHVSGNLQEL